MKHAIYTPEMQVTRALIAADFLEGHARVNVDRETVNSIKDMRGIIAELIAKDEPSLNRLLAIEFSAALQQIMDDIQEDSK